MGQAPGAPDAYAELVNTDIVEHIHPDTIFSLALLSPGTAPEAQNIFGQGSYAITGYDKSSFTPLVAMSTDTLLMAFDMRTNSSVVVGSTKNTVYNSLANGDVKYNTTYYPIGDPDIMVSVSTNGADPYGEYWKCEHKNYSGLDGIGTGTGPDFTQKSVIITSRDGIRYCMPLGLAASTNENHQIALAKAFRRQNALHAFIVSDTNQAYDPVYGEIRDTSSTPRNSVLNLQEWIDQAFESESVLSFNVVWHADSIDALKLDPEEYPSAGTDESDGKGFLIETAGDVSVYRESKLVGDYKNRQVARENEFEVTYSLLEKEGLLQRFGKGRSYNIGDALNSIYMGMAQFLVSTHIESAYTFKTVKMQQLTNEQITPSSLAAQEGSVQTQRIVDSTVEARASSGYYPSDFVDPLSGDSYTSPAAPVGGFWEASLPGADAEGPDRDALVEGSESTDPTGGYGS